MNIKFMSVSMDCDSMNIINKFCKNNSLNRSEFVRKTLLEKIKKGERKIGKKIK